VVTVVVGGIGENIKKRKRRKKKCRRRKLFNSAQNSEYVHVNNW